MRSTIWLTILGVGCLALGLRVLPDVPPGHLRAGRLPPAQSIGRTYTIDTASKLAARPELARHDALERAQAEIAGLLRQQAPPLEWTPPLTFVDRLVRHCEITPVRQTDPLLGEFMYTAALGVELTPERQRELFRLERDERSLERMLLAAKWLGVGVLGLILVAAYVRLDIWTKGYLTRRLQLAGVGILLSAALVAWRWM